MIEGKKITVYVATNLVNGHRYVGVTTRPLSVRRRCHVRAAHDGSKGRLHAAIRKYGPDALRFSVVAQELTLAKALATETRLIALWRPEYNVTTGGEHPRGVQAWNRRPVTCLEDGRVFDSMTDAAIFYRVAVSEICKAVNAERGKVSGRHFVRGRVCMSEDERANKIIAMERSAATRRSAMRRSGPRARVHGAVVAGVDCRGRRATGPMKNRRQVSCLDDGRIFQSASDAARYYDVARSSLIELCLAKNGRKSVGGLRFCYIGAEK
jgi:hypothetical protein